MKKDRVITKLARDDGTEATDPEEITKMAKEYWKEVMSTQDTTTKDLTKDTEQLTEVKKWKLNKSIVLNKLLTATRQLAPNKIPGPDGLPAEIYKKFPTLVKFLHHVWTSCFQITDTIDQSNMVLFYNTYGPAVSKSPTP